MIADPIVEVIVIGIATEQKNILFLNIRITATDVRSIGGR